MKIAVRHSLIAIAVLGAVTCVISLVLLSRMFSNSAAQRFDRAREQDLQQLGFQRTSEPASRPLAAPVALAPPRMGMRLGLLPRSASVDSITPALDPAQRELLARSIRAALASHNDQPALQSIEDGDSGLIVGAATTQAGDIAWLVHPLIPPPWVRVFRLMVLSLGVAGLALVLVSAHMAASVSRGAGLLKDALRSLGRDLQAPVPRPAPRELSEVAEGIAALAGELRSAQAEQARLGRELAERERLASLGRVAAGVAHEVRNPLAAIKLRVDLVRMDPALSGSTGQELAGVSDEIARLDRLVSDLLVITGRRTGPRVEAELRVLAEQRASLMRPWAGERQVRIEIRGRGTARVDVDAVGRVIDNLLRNGVEASPAGGVVEVAIEGDAHGATLVVSDRGPGVDPERSHELFEPFFTTKPEGMGLGLALSKAIANAHGGVLGHRREGGVTSFALSLPASSQEEDEESPAARQPSQPGQELRHA